MMQSVHSHTHPSLPRAVTPVLEVVIVPFQLVHLVCLIIGPFLGLACLAWPVVGDVWPLDAAPGALHQSRGLPTPWESNIWTLIALYGSFFWLFYLLPSTEGVEGRARARNVKTHPMQAVWKHAGLWGLTFGPLAYLCGGYTDLTWPVWGCVVAEIVWAFYEEVWKDIRREMQQNSEALRALKNVKSFHGGGVATDCAGVHRPPKKRGIRGVDVAN